MEVKQNVAFWKWDYISLSDPQAANIYRSHFHFCDSLTSCIQAMWYHNWKELISSQWELALPLVVTHTHQECLVCKDELHCLSSADGFLYSAWLTQSPPELNISHSMKKHDKLQKQLSIACDGTGPRSTSKSLWCSCPDPPN